jgi:hypothetical protein
MIRKNEQIGNTKDVTLIELGEGDVQIGSIFSKEEKYVGVQFINDKKNPIGTRHNTAGCTTDNTKPQVIISFTNVESIEVIERALARAKVSLRNI